MKSIEFEVDGTKYQIKSPSSRVTQEASRRYSIEFTKCLREGIMTQEQMKDFLMEHKVWTEEDEKEEQEITKKIADLEVEIFRGSPRKKKVTLEEGRKKSLEMRELRSRYANLLSERQSYESNTAENIADNARFDFLVSECTFNEDNTKVYNSYEDYLEKSSDELAFTAASVLAKNMYQLDDNFQKNLPENRFLSMFGLIDEDMRLIDKDGNLVDEDYRKINELGHYIDEDGSRVDKFGNPLTEDGIFDLQAVYVDEKGKKILPKTAKVEEAPKEEVEEEAV